MSLEPSFLLRLAEANVDRGELAAACAALGAALEQGDAATRAAAPDLLARLRAAATAGDAALLARIDALGARAAAPASAARPAAGAPAAADDDLRSSTGPGGSLAALASPPPGPLRTAIALRHLASSAELQTTAGAKTGAAPALPVLEVVARLLASDLDVAATAGVALDLVARACGAERAHIVMGGTSRSFGLPGGPERPPETSRGVLDEVARTRRAVALGDAQADPRFGGRESVQELGLRSVLAIPVLDGDALVAALWLEGPVGRLGARERATAEALAALVGPGLARARREEQAQAELARKDELLRRERAASRRLTEPLLLGRSQAIRALRALLERVAPSGHTVLIEGESGTGKELVARTVHALSPRADGPFVAENVAALTGSLAEAELFGHAKGSFTGADEDRPGLFELASGGTLLLDEVGEMEPDLQAKLLRVLAEGEVRPVGAAQPVKVDVRVVAATHRDLAALVAEGRFRQDLFYRLSVIRVRVPPLRERPEDVAPLLEHFLALAAGELDRAPPAVRPDLLARLQHSPWPGNVRQLRAWATRHVLTGETATDEEPAPGAAETGDPRLRLDLQVGDPPYDLREARTAFDRRYLAAILEHTGGNVSAAAKVLGMNRSHLSTLVSRFRLKPRKG